MNPAPEIVTSPNANGLVLLVVAIVSIYCLRALLLAREGVRLHLRNTTIAGVVFVGCLIMMRGEQVQPSVALAISWVIAALVFFYQEASKRRSRYIPKSVRRAVIARDLKGKRYDSSKHHIDHIWPFARGGSHTVENLRVIERRKNLKKGAKRPRIWEMW